MSIVKLYKQYLGRMPDPGGYAHFENALRSGATLSQVANTIKSSAEGRAYASKTSAPAPKPTPVPTQTRAPRTLAEAIAYGERAEKAGVDPDEAAKNYIAERKQDEVRKILTSSPYQSTGEAMGANYARRGNEFARKYLEDTAPKPTPVPTSKPTPAPVQNVGPQPTTETPTSTPSPKPGGGGGGGGGGAAGAGAGAEPLPEPEGPPDYDYMRKLKSIGVKVPKSPAEQQGRGRGTSGAFGRKGLRITSLNLA